MPTFEQIESLQTQYYIHKKSGWKIGEYQNMIFDESECLILISFSKIKNGNHVDNSPKTCLINCMGNVQWRRQ
jgi:hypothetical protein